MTPHAEYKLKNGLDVVYRLKPESKIVSVQVWIKTGSVNENIKNNGISHFLEHLVFKGTANYAPDEIDYVVESCGGIMNAGTSKDYTMYYITLPSEHAEVAFKVLSDMVFRALVIPEEIEKEKPVVVQEIERKYNDPSYEMWDNVTQDLFSPTPYMMEIIGTEANVMSFDSSILMSYYKTHYHPHNISLIIVGDLPEDDAASLANNYFGITYDASQSLSYNTDWKRSLTDSSSKVFCNDVNQDYTVVAYQVDATVKDSIRYEVLSEVFTGGEYSILNKSLKYDQGLVTYVASGEILNQFSGGYLFHFSGSAGSSERSVEAMDLVLHGILKKGLDLSEFEKAKNRLRSRHVFVREKTDSEASELGYAYTVGMADYLNNYLKYLDSIEIHDIMDIIGSMIKLPRLVYKTVPLNK